MDVVDLVADATTTIASEATEATVTAAVARYDSQMLINLGVFMGILHVLAGPDHLCALATLSVGSSWKAALLGFRWGIGHSTGLVVVFVFFMALQEEIDLKAIGRYADGTVGLLMVILGVYGIVITIRNYKLKKMKKEIMDSHDESGQLQSIEEFGKVSNAAAPPVNRGGCDLKDPMMQKIIAFVIGTVHGIGGPGGVLGVLPVVELNDWSAAGLYILSFVVSSTICMGAFAAFYGEVTKRIGATAEAVEFYINIFSCALSVVVGLVWFVMSINGKLDELFH